MCRAETMRVGVVNGGGADPQDGVIVTLAR